MQKSHIKSIIEKYYLNGLTEKARFIIKDNSIGINFIPEVDKALIGIVEAPLEIEDAELGVYNTTQLLKLIKLLDNNIQVSLNKVKNIYNKIIIQDNKYDLEYYLADLNTIGKVPKVKEPNKYDISLSLDEEFIDKFIDAKKALPEAEQARISIDVLEPNKLIIELGINSSYANKIKFSTLITSEIDNLPPIPFSINSLYEILVANYEANTGTLSLSKEGLLKLHFVEGEIKSTYYLVRLEE